MKDLKHLSFSELIDLLMEQTERHIEPVHSSNGQQLNISREFLKAIQNEIMNRRKAIISGA